jgi:histidinol-phosphate/aromatic aminotransferase/cobyric acid decarboxylase-like protein
MLQLMEENNIVIRDYRGTDFFRITIGTAEENEAVLAVLKQFGEEL